MKCPNCEPEVEMERIDKGGQTEVLSCPKCPYVAFEYHDFDNIRDLMVALGHDTIE